MGSYLSDFYKYTVFSENGSAYSTETSTRVEKDKEGSL